MNPWVPATTWKTQDEFCAPDFRIAQCCFSNKSYFFKKKGIYRSNLFLPFKWVKSFFWKRFSSSPPNSFQPVKISFNTQPLQIRDFFFPSLRSLFSQNDKATTTSDGGVKMEGYLVMSKPTELIWARSWILKNFLFFFHNPHIKPNYSPRFKINYCTRSGLLLLYKILRRAKNCKEFCELNNFKDKWDDFVQKK